ncbi:MAG: hypothetical protein V1645_01970 [archaeon]
MKKLACLFILAMVFVPIAANAQGFLFGFVTGLAVGGDGDRPPNNIHQLYLAPRVSERVSVMDLRFNYFSVWSNDTLLATIKRQVDKDFFEKYELLEVVRFFNGGNVVLYVIYADKGKVKSLDSLPPLPSQR